MLILKSQFETITNLPAICHQHGMQYPLVHTELIHHPMDHNEIEHVRKSVQPIEINVNERKTN